MSMIGRNRQVACTTLWKWQFHYLTNHLVPTEEALRGQRNSPCFYYRNLHLWGRKTMITIIILNLHKKTKTKVSKPLSSKKQCSIVFWPIAICLCGVVKHEPANYICLTCGTSAWLINCFLVSNGIVLEKPWIWEEDRHRRGFYNIPIRVLNTVISALFWLGLASLNKKLREDLIFGYALINEQKLLTIFKIPGCCPILPSLHLDKHNLSSFGWNCVSLQLTTSIRLFD